MGEAKTVDAGPWVESGFNPATMAMEARCTCGALVASMTREAMREVKDPSSIWVGLRWRGIRNHVEAGCNVNGAE